MKDLTTKQDWFRLILMAGFAAYLVQRIYFKTDLLLKKETGFTEEFMDSDEMTFPSITFCPSFMVDGDDDDEPNYNITDDSLNLPHLENLLILVRQNININKYEGIYICY